MNIIDIVIVLLLASAVIRGKELGFVRQLFSTLGFFLGLWIGTLLEPHTVRLAHSEISRSVVTVFTTLGSGLILLSLGEYLGIVVKSKVKIKALTHVDSVLGIGVAVVSILLGSWLAASIILSLPAPGAQSLLRGSGIITLMNRELPPATTIVADLSHIIEPNGFPQVFTGLEPRPNTNVPLPNLGDLLPAVQKDRASVVKIEGQGCGGIVEGSGFVINSSMIATNAHVVAGISKPYVLDGNSTHSSTVVSFDPNLDLAILRVTHLAGKPLQISTTTATDGTAAAVLGYPGGGNFSAKPAAVLDTFTATGRNIYNQGDTNREIYEVKADIIPGNSGGPLINKNGLVIGVVFAESTTYNHVGYALQTGKVLSEIGQAKNRTQAISTGTCAE
jgi:S1-C subfamily serine protease